MYINTQTNRTSKAPLNKSGQIVNENDAAAHGNYKIAENQPEQLKFKTFTGWDTSTGVAVKQYADIPINEAKAQLIAQIKEKRWVTQFAGFTWTDENGENWLQGTDEQSRLNINDCLLIPNWTGTWYFLNGERVLTIEHLQQIKTTGLQFVGNLFNKQTEKINEVRELTTIEACRNYDVNAGW